MFQCQHQLEKKDLLRSKFVKSKDHLKVTANVIIFKDRKDSVRPVVYKGALIWS